MPVLRERNKKRLYLAYYGQPGRYVPFHTALLLVPKECSNTARDAVRFHIKNNVKILPDGEKETSWSYERVETTARTIRLTAVQLLGKVSSDAETRLFSIIENVPMVSGDDNWWCCNWAWNVVQVST